MTGDGLAGGNQPLEVRGFALLVHFKLPMSPSQGN